MICSPNEQAKKEIMRLYEQSKAISAGQVPHNGHDSGIGSAPSSVTGSVSSTDTVHGGSDEDLIDMTPHNTVQSRSRENWHRGELNFSLKRSQLK